MLFGSLVKLRHLLLLNLLSIVKTMVWRLTAFFPVGRTCTNIAVIIIA